MSTLETASDYPVFVEADFQPGGRCWPPHPVEDYSDCLVVVDAMDEQGNLRLDLIPEMLDDAADVMAVQLGLLTVEQLAEKWGLEIPSCPTPTAPPSRPRKRYTKKRLPTALVDSLA